jgi:hypothetical protein
MQVSDDRFQAESGWNVQFHPDSAWKLGILSASGWLFRKKYITMHGSTNVKLVIFAEFIRLKTGSESDR